MENETGNKDKVNSEEGNLSGQVRRLIESKLVLFTDTCLLYSNCFSVVKESDEMIDIVKQWSINYPLAVVGPEVLDTSLRVFDIRWRFVFVYGEGVKLVIAAHSVDTVKFTRVCEVDDLDVLKDFKKHMLSYVGSVLYG